MGEKEKAIFKKVASRQLTPEEAFRLIKENGRKKPEEGQSIEEIVKEQFSEMLKIKKERIKSENNFEEYGMDSIRLIEFSRILSKVFQTKIAPEHILDCGTIANLAEFLEEQHISCSSEKMVEKQKSEEKTQPTVKKEYENWGLDLKEEKITIIHAEKKFSPEHFEDFWDDLRQRKHKELLVSQVSLDYFQELQKNGYSYMHLLVNPTVGEKMELYTAGTGRTLLILTGIGVTPGFYKYQIQEFAKDYRVVCFSMPGVGLSKYMEDVSLEHIAEVIISSLDAIGAEGPMDIIGVSWGSLLASTIAYKYSERTGKVILGAPITNMEVSYKEDEDLDDVDGAMKADFEGVSGGKQGFELFTKTKCIDMRAFLNYGKYFGKESKAPHNVKKILPEIKAPTLILYGENDTVNSYDKVEEVYKMLHNAEIVKMEDAAHLPMVTCPERFNKQVKMFFYGKKS